MEEFSVVTWAKPEWSELEGEWGERELETVKTTFSGILMQKWVKKWDSSWGRGRESWDQEKMKNGRDNGSVVCSWRVGAVRCRLTMSVTMDDQSMWWKASVELKCCWVGTLEQKVGKLHLRWWKAQTLSFYFLAMLLGMWDLSSLTRNQTHTPCSGSTESYPPNH